MRSAANKKQFHPITVQNAEDLWRRVAPEPNSGCWLWLGYVNDHGYGMVAYKKSVRGAHRVIYELTHGPIDRGLCLDHLCRVRLCVNPDHLEPVTQRVNVHRGISLAAVSAAKETCKCGNKLEPRKDRGRRCSACKASYDAKRYQRIRAALKAKDQS